MSVNNGYITIHFNWEINKYLQIILLYTKYGHAHAKNIYIDICLGFIMVFINPWYFSRRSSPPLNGEHDDNVFFLITQGNIFSELSTRHLYLSWGVIVVHFDH